MMILEQGGAIISQPTALHFALTQSINPSTSIIMTMSQNTGVFVNGNFSAQNIYNKRTEVNDGLNVNDRRKRDCILSAQIYRYKSHGKFRDSRRRQLAQRRYRRTLDNYYKLRVAGDVYVNDSTSGNGIGFGKPAKQSSAHLTPDESIYDRPKRSMDWQMGFVYGIKRVVLSFSRDGLQFWLRVYWRISGKRHQAIKPHSQ